MTKLIGLKEFQQNTKRIREEVALGVNFIVIYRSKPIFEIKPLKQEAGFATELEKSNLYNDEFIVQMKEAESNINAGKVKDYSKESFLKSLS